MSASDATELALVRYIYRATAPSWAAAGNFYLALYTADPGEAGSANTNEISYTGYARQALARPAAFTDTSPTTNASDITFPQMSGGTGGSATHFAVVDTSSGAGTIIVSDVLTTPQSIVVGVQPRVLAGALSLSVV